MIFDRNYDKALWMLVSGTKKDNERIYELFKSYAYQKKKELQALMDSLEL